MIWKSNKFCWKEATYVNVKLNDSMFDKDIPRLEEGHIIYILERVKLPEKIKNMQNIFLIFTGGKRNLNIFSPTLIFQTSTNIHAY